MLASLGFAGSPPTYNKQDLRLKGSHNNNFPFWKADSSRLSALRKLEIYPIFLHFRALPDGRFDFPNSQSYCFASPNLMALGMDGIHTQGLEGALLQR